MIRPPPTSTLFPYTTLFRSVRTLTHTRVTPNAVTVVGLLVGIVSAYCFSKGFYLTSVLGALLFFLSGLCDEDRKSTRLNSSHITISYAVFCLKKKTKKSTDY